MDRLKGKVILISGGARGQGAAEARLFAEEGARVVIGDVLEPEGRQLTSELGHDAAFVRQDVTQESDWETPVTAAAKLCGLPLIFRGRASADGCPKPAVSRWCWSSQSRRGAMRFGLRQSGSGSFISSSRQSMWFS